MMRPFKCIDGVAMLSGVMVKVMWAELGDGRYSYNTDGLVIVMLVAIEVMMIVMLLIILRYFFIILSRQ